MKHWLKKPIALPLLAMTGLAILIILVKSRSTPEIVHHSEFATPAKIASLSEQMITPIAIGFGTVNPTSNLQVPAEVAGEVLWVHPKLKKGSEIKTGETVVKLDQRDYQLTLSKAKAELSSKKTQLAELLLEEKNTQQKLILMEKKLQLNEAEFARKQALSKQGAISASQLDAEEQILINMRTEFKNLQLQQDLHPKQRELLNAEISVAKASIEEQRRNLDRTEIAMPFDARIGEVSVEKGSFINKGSTLFIAQGKDQVEIEAQFPIERMVPLLVGYPSESFEGLDDQARLNAFDWQAKVRLVGGITTAEWDAKVVRGSDSIDPQTRTLSIVVAIDSPHKQTIIGKRPPLLKGMYVQVSIQSKAKTGWKIPRSALHENNIYFMDADNRLRIKDDLIAYQMGDFAVLKEKPEFSSLIISDIIPAVEGMLIEPFVEAVQ